MHEAVSTVPRREEHPRHLNGQLRSARGRYQRLLNYLATAQVYLNQNVLREEPLRPEHIKRRLLGHGGTTPGINLVYKHLNHLMLDTDASILLVTGGHDMKGEE